MHVFISYAREDGDPFARRLLETLPIEKEFTVWRDIERLTSLDDWRSQLRQALFGTDAVVVLMTPGAASSKFVELEYEVAKTLGKPVLTALCLPCEIPEALRASHYHDLSNPRTYEREMAALRRDLKETQEKPIAEIRDELERLQHDPAFAVFETALGRLQRWLNAGKFEPRIIRAIVWLCRRIQDDSRHDGSVRARIEAAREGTYIQREWDIFKLQEKEGLAFAFILAELSKDIESTVAANAVNVPIVLAVMVSAEVEALVDGTAFDEYPDDLHRDFQELRDILVANGLEDWSGRYGATPQDWCPFARDASTTIASVVRAVLHGMDAGKRLIPSFIDIRDLAGDRNRNLLRHLRDNGCILIVDSISMRHPVIQRALHQSMLDAHAKTSVVNIAPIQSAFEVLRRMRVVLHIKASDLEFHRRRTDRLEEYGGCREIHEAQELEQWLSDRVRKLFAPVIGRTGVAGQQFQFLDGRR
jgi:hypothetical protein